MLASVCDYIGLIYLIPQNNSSTDGRTTCFHSMYVSKLQVHSCSTFLTKCMMSCARSFGSSKAAKCPPRGM